MNIEKKIAAERAVEMIEDNMVVGLGTGSTATFMIHALAERVTNGLSITGVPSSQRTADLAKECGIPLTTLDEAVILDINIDGADEFDSKLQMIKGGGGALLREKIIAYNSKQNVIITDSSKQVEKLGKFKLPIEVIPFSKNGILRKLEKMGLQPALRIKNEVPFETDENNVIIDVNAFGFDDLHELNHTLLAIPGVVETGLFLDLADYIIMGKDKSITIFEKNKS